MDHTFVIVGASLAGGKAAETLREEGYDGQVVLVGAEAERPYERPPLSKDLLLGKGERDQVYLHPPEWYDAHGVELRLGTPVTVLDPTGHFVELAGERILYDKLLLATGSVPRTLDVPGADADGVLYLRTLADAERIGAVLREGARLVVVGAGWIGLEVAAAGRQHGVAVTVVEQAALPLQRVLGDEVARVFADLHRGHGVDLRFGTWVSRIVAEQGRVAAVVLADGTELPADAVVVGVGVRPVTELATAADLAVDDGVLVDAALRSSNPDIFAAGDVANVDHPLFGRRIRVEHWANALHGGPAAARSMLGQDVVYDAVPYFFTDQYDLGMEYAGYVAPGGYDEVVFRGAPPEPGSGVAGEFIAFWLAGGRVLAGMNVNVWDVTDAIQALVRSGRPVDPARLTDPAVPLESLAAPG
ncbi:MAG TPA: FAD-dependent oxidoreductase [Mycobacteriales bacterium]|nr:FAD-dependent oxidoreductase [Mycobacteriales bacterium]